MYVLGMLQSHPFVRKAILGKSNQLIVGLYTDQQIASLHQACCCDTEGSVGSMLGVDRTFNLGPCYMTAVVFTSRLVVRNDTRTSPTIAGPMYLHWDGCYAMYVDIFTHLRSTVDSTIAKTELRLSSNIVTGSVEEKGLTKAKRDIFHDATHLLCAKHLKDNIVDYMRNKCGCSSRLVLSLSARGSDDGLVNANDSVAFRQQADAFAAECESVSAQLAQHFV